MKAVPSFWFTCLLVHQVKAEPEASFQKAQTSSLLGKDPYFFDLQNTHGLTGIHGPAFVLPRPRQLKIGVHRDCFREELKAVGGR